MLPDYPKQLHVEYKRQGDAIPLGMANVYPYAIPMEMYKGEPIILKSKEDSEISAARRAEEKWQIFG